MWYLNAQVGQHIFHLGVKPVLCFQEYFQLHFICSDFNYIRMKISYEVSEYKHVAFKPIGRTT
jgi:hypothetical protein